MNKTYVIDRIEEDIAVCVDGDGNVINIPQENIPKEAAECDSLTEENGKFILQKTNSGETQKKFDRLFKK